MIDSILSEIWFHKKALLPVGRSAELFRLKNLMLRYPPAQGCPNDTYGRSPDLRIILENAFPGCPSGIMFSRPLIQ